LIRKWLVLVLRKHMCSHCMRKASPNAVINKYSDVFMDPSWAIHIPPGGLVENHMH
jgi:hypothetical protein